MGKICNLGSLRLHLLAFQALIIAAKIGQAVAGSAGPVPPPMLKPMTPAQFIQMWGTNFVTHVIQIVILSSKGPEEPRVQGTRRTIMYIL